MGGGERQIGLHHINNRLFDPWREYIYSQMSLEVASPEKGVIQAQSWRRLNRL